MALFNLAGNIYYVGTYKQSSHLIVTKDGLILIDVGDENNAQHVVESIKTLGTYSFFFETEVDGKLMRAGMFGGAGVGQMSKAYLDKDGLYYHQRGDFIRSLKKLRNERVDIFLGNHAWNNKTLEKYERSLTQKENPFLNSNGKWQGFLDAKEHELRNMILKEVGDLFVNFAHRGALEYAPENTMMAFNLGIFMGAGGICDYTYAELLNFRAKKDALSDRIVTLDEFFTAFGWRDFTFAIELKGVDTERTVADAIRKHGVGKKSTVTSFKLEYLAKIHEYDPALNLGFLTSRCDDALMDELKACGIDEYSPRASRPHHPRTCRQVALRGLQSKSVWRKGRDAYEIRIQGRC